MTKDQARIDVALEILSRVHQNLCNSRKIKQAEELTEINRRLILLSEKI